MARNHNAASYVANLKFDDIPPGTGARKVLTLDFLQRIRRGGMRSRRHRC
jgi:hypothetical protein